MTQHEIAQIAYDHLQHFWEMNGSNADPMTMISQIVTAMENSIFSVKGNNSLKRQIEDVLYARWSELNTEED